MSCFSCFRKPKKKGELETLNEADDKVPEDLNDLPERSSVPRKASSSPEADTLPKRGSLQSSQSIYYDCKDSLDRPGASKSDGQDSADGLARQSNDANGASGLPGSDAQASRKLRKLLAGSLRVGEHRGVVDGIGQYEQADPTGFMIRGKEYMANKAKVNAQGEVYRLIGCDVYSAEQKVHHIAQYIDLPEPPRLSSEHKGLPREKQLPPLLIVNIQLPLYKTAMIPGRGSTDGKAAHIVQYFGLPEDLQLSSIGNDAAVDLLLRLINEQKTSNGDNTRDRLKLIARVVNVDEWAKKAPLSGYEHGLLRNYNDKPILTRPQHRFYKEENYLEIDLDVHSYAWAARKALSGFLPRLGSVVFENALVVQGNSKEELPEIVMACARLSHLDFTKAQPFPEDLHNEQRSSDSGASANHQLHAHTFPDDTIPAEAHADSSQ